MDSAAEAFSNQINDTVRYQINDTDLHKPFKDVIRFEACTWYRGMLRALKADVVAGNLTEAVSLLAESSVTPLVIQPPALGLHGLQRPELAVGVRVRLRMINDQDLEILRFDRGQHPIHGHITDVHTRKFTVEWLTAGRPKVVYASGRLYGLLRLEYGEEE